ncbi:uncharacterized protein EV422DRAFT_565415 [Fimicolochytrium jonesii]|uniref:uncharacterized protein n=1 Tax=Fimicolochytrium jonesii TaxID=1396493 RepID=UPI0022FEFA32|nr:uncharacterized protein EV422DRAFT_565415 [Fimicolochytrium jonesii]KAI8823471.1 hypothetical protein EV422DRAFT_565415 [Fimicolochytrium jonesii]
MSIFPKESIQAIADSAGITIKDDVAVALVQDVEYRLREVVHEARKFMRHAKRNKLHPEDVNHALRVRNVEPLYGWTSGKSSTFKMIGQGAQPFFYVEDQEVDLEEILNRALPPVPLDVTYTSHWLAIDGVQPATVHNPTPPARHPALVQKAGRASQPHREPLVKTVLTKELQLYYEKVTEAVVGESEELRALSLQSVAKDPGIQPLIPYFVQFIGDQIAENTKKLPMSFAMMRLARALLDNANLFIEPYLHQLIPNILSCIVGKRLCEDPATEDHWALRRYASQLASYICVTYGGTYQSLQPRVSKTLYKAIVDPARSFAQRYGGFVGLAALGDEAVRIVLKKKLGMIGELTEAVVNEMEEGGTVPQAIRRMEAIKCREVAVDIAIKYYRNIIEERTATGHGPTDGPELRKELDDELGVLADVVWDALFNSSPSNGV